MKKPAGFHWDIFLLGLTTGVAGILGLPFPNGLIPQAPFHTESLCVTKVVHDKVNTDAEAGGEGGDNKGHDPRHQPWQVQRTHVVEQRVSNLAQGLLTLGTMSGPLLVVLHLIPQGVLAGLFFIMGYQALEANGITVKIMYLLRDRHLVASDDPLNKISRRAAIWWFVVLELIGFGATFAITQTVAAVGFPCFIFALIPMRALLLPRLFSAQELSVLDAPTASDFTMESVGGTYGAVNLEMDGGDDGEEIGGASPGGVMREKRRSGEEGTGSGLDSLFVGERRCEGTTEEDLVDLGESRSVRISASEPSAGARRRN